MKPKPLHVLHRQAATAQLAEVEMNAEFCIQVVRWLLRELQGESSLHEFLLEKLEKIPPQVTQLQIRVDNLTTLADPDLPHDLPF